MQIPPFVSLCKYGFWSHERTHSIEIGKHVNTLVIGKLEAQIKHSLPSAKWQNAQVLMCKIVLFIIKLFDFSAY